MPIDNIPYGRVYYLCYAAGDSWQTCYNFPLSVRQTICLHYHSTCLQHSSALFPARVVHCVVATNAANYQAANSTFSCLIPDHQTWERRIDLIPSKNFRGYPRPWKYFTRKFKARNFLNTKISKSTVHVTSLISLLPPLVHTALAIHQDCLWQPPQLDWAHHLTGHLQQQLQNISKVNERLLCLVTSCDL